MREGNKNLGLIIKETLCYESKSFINFHFKPTLNMQPNLEQPEKEEQDQRFQTCMHPTQFLNIIL